jgi:hypothetical protein
MEPVARLYCACLVGTAGRLLVPDGRYMFAVVIMWVLTISIRSPATRNLNPVS